MARAITKSFNAKNVKLVIRRINKDGQMVEETYTAPGRSVNGAKAALAKKLKTTNFMVVSSEVIEGGEEETYTMSAEAFYALSETCEDDKVYGHDTVTVTFKVTIALYYTMKDTDAHSFSMVGTTTERKLRKAISESIDDENILVASTKVVNVKRWLSKEEFVKNGTKVQK